MSALIAVCGPDAVHLLTDAVRMTPDGIVWEITRKQAILKNGAAAAGIGFSPACLRFAQLADACAKNFDEMVAATPRLWAEARSTLSTKEKELRCAAVFAGWSEKGTRLKLHLILAEGGTYADAVVYAAGPTESADVLVDPFVKRFAADPNSFDARRDGVELMEGMRLHHPRQFGRLRWPAVGGFVQHTVITRTDVETEIIHHWPDTVGRHIELGMADLHKVCEVLQGTASTSEHRRG